MTWGVENKSNVRRNVKGMDGRTDEGGVGNGRRGEEKYEA